MKPSSSNPVTGLVSAGAKAKTGAIVLGLAVSMLLARSAGQTGDGYSSPASPSSPSTGIAQGLSHGVYGGSVQQGQVRPEVIPLSFKDAIELGLKNNLGLLLQADNRIASRGQKWKELSELLPNFSAAVSENVAKINLAAEGLRFPGFPAVIGPFGFFDARTYLTQSLVNLKALNRTRGASDNELAALYTYKDAREFVVLAVGNAYLQALAGEARVAAAQAQMETAQALYDKTADQQKAGVSPAIDTLRSKVELQSRQQQLIVARNDYAKQKLRLARVIGLPVGQEFTLADKAPYQALIPMGVEDSLQRAYTSRSDYLAAAAQVRAAEHFRKAASAEYFPTLGVSANYGASGVTPGGAHGSEGTYQVSGALTIPIFQGGKTHADVLQAEATLRQSREQLANLRGQIEYEVRSALLDLAAANEQVEVARSSVDLANQALAQARDRFAAGVTDNLEVVQAQESVASANENYISSLYAHNVAKIAMARAAGFAEEGVRQYLSNK
jgi:outer membrane protein TolC